MESWKEDGIRRRCRTCRRHLLISGERKETLSTRVIPFKLAGEPGKPQGWGLSTMGIVNMLDWRDESSEGNAPETVRPTKSAWGSGIDQTATLSMGGSFILAVDKEVSDAALSSTTIEPSMSDAVKCSDRRSEVVNSRRTLRESQWWRER